MSIAGCRCQGGLGHTVKMDVIESINQRTITYNGTEWLSVSPYMILSKSVCGKNRKQATVSQVFEK